MYSLVADYFVKFEYKYSISGSYRLQKYIDVSGICEPVINVSQDSSIFDCRNNCLSDSLNPLYVHCDNSCYKLIVKDNKLVTLLTPLINGYSDAIIENIKKIEVTNQLTKDNRLYVLPSSCTNVAQYHLAHLPPNYIQESKENRARYEECIKNTLTMDEFLDQFNNAGHNSLENFKKRNEHIHIDTLQYELKKAQEHIKELKEQNTLLVSAIRNAEEIESSQQTMISSLYNDIEDTKAQLNRVTDEKRHLKSEVDTLVQCMANILKDVAYLKTVSPMIDM